MRKIFEGQTPVSLVLIFATFVFACFLRLYDLDAQSPWTDEVASWFYLRHLDRVFYHESHSPLYYALLRLLLGDDASMYGIRMVSALGSIMHLVWAFVLGRKIFTPHQLLLFWVLLCFSPLDIVYARMARHYAWLFESVLLFVLWIRLRSPTWWLSVLAAMMGLVHIFALIPIWVMMGLEYLRVKNLRRLLIVLSSSSLIVVYYIARFLMLGKEKVASNVSWNSESFTSLLKALVLMPLGDAYPRHQFFPVPFALALTLVILCLGLILWKRTEMARIFILTLIFSLLAIELASLYGVNLRVSRYLIFLVPLLIVAVVDSLKLEKNWPVFFVMTASLLFLSWSNPIKTYAWDRESVEEWKNFSSHAEDVPKLVCANPYQIAYYGFPDIHPCSSYISRLDTSKPLLYFDLNGNDRILSLYLHEKLQLVDFKTYGQSLMIRFKPR